MKQQNRNLENFMSYFSNYSNWKLQKHIPFSFFFQIFFLMKLCQRKKKVDFFFFHSNVFLLNDWTILCFSNPSEKISFPLQSHSPMEWPDDFFSFPPTSFSFWKGELFYFIFLTPLSLGMGGHFFLSPPTIFIPLDPQFSLIFETFNSQE